MRPETPVQLRRQRMHTVFASNVNCYESPHDPAQWFHRGQIAEWLHDQLALDVPEFGQGCGLAKSARWPSCDCFD